MKCTRQFLLSFFLLLASIACQTKTTSSGEGIGHLLSEVLKDADIKKSPNADYAALVGGDKNKNISTVIVVSLSDSTIVYQKNIYLDSVSWIGKSLLRIYVRPEMVRVDENENHFYDISFDKKEKTDL